MIKCLTLGLYKTNCYLLFHEGQVLLIDPGFHGSKIIEAMGEAEPVGILLTHAHSDHICAVDDLRAYYQAKQGLTLPVYLRKPDEELLYIRRRVPSSYRRGCQAPITELEMGILTLGSFTVEVFAAPGHSAGGAMIAWGNNLFTGDTIFKDTVGTTNTYNGDIKALRQTLLYWMTCEQDYVVYPGHGEKTTLKREQQYNQKWRAIVGDKV